LSIEGTTVGERQMAILDNAGDGVALIANQPARALLIAGKPLSEPIAQHGPFVMNTEEELQMAVRDYREGRFSAPA
jgi:redox-sensitive bicupin YhaK (pirin superfamily)